MKYNDYHQQRTQELRDATWPGDVGLKYIETWKMEWILVGGDIMVTPCCSPVSSPLSWPYVKWPLSGPCSSRERVTLLLLF